MCKCCVITGKNGSAKFYKDVPIEEEYKFENKKENINKIVFAIEKCLKNYDIEVKKFNNYCEIISSEEEIFEKNIEEIFERN